MIPVRLTHSTRMLSSTADAAAEPGAVYVQGMGNDGEMPTPTPGAGIKDEDLPVAVPIEAEVVAAPPPVKYDDSKPAAIPQKQSLVVQSAPEQSSGIMHMYNDARFGRRPCMMAVSSSKAKVLGGGVVSHHY